VSEAREVVELLLLYVVTNLSQREEQRLRVFENRMLRRIFGLKRDEATGEWRNLMTCTHHQISFG
jgi:hypothetical protein